LLQSFSLYVAAGYNQGCSKIGCEKANPNKYFFMELIFNVVAVHFNLGHLEPSNNDVVEYTNCINKNTKQNLIS
jgi:hypothetical protein